MMVRSTFLRICLIATIAAAASAIVRAQGTDLPKRSQLPQLGGTIMGRVVTPSGGTIKGRVMVRLSNFSSSGVMNYTDSNGEFIFTRLIPGNFSLEVVADPSVYEPAIESVNLPPSGRVVLTIHLREKTGSNNKPAGGVVSAGDLDQKVPDSAKREFETATKLLEKSDTKQAVEHLKRAIAIWPDYLVARNTLGVELLKLKQLSGAAEQFDAAIRINPKSFNSRLYMGILLVQQKQYAEAIGHLSQALSIDSTQATAHLYLGIASLGAGDLAVAHNALSKAISIGGIQYSIAHYYIAHVQIKRGERDLAMQELEIYLEESPKGEQSAHARTLLEKLKSGS
jgi:Tfp pilus assembly protein PilF